MSNKRKKNRKKKNQQPHPCPHCGATKTGRRCHSPACVALRNTPTKYAADWQRWAFPGLLARMIGKNVIAQGRRDNDQTLIKIGERVYRWTNEACDLARQFPVSTEYATAQQTRFDRETDKIWDANKPLDLARITNVLEILVADVKEYFTGKGFTPLQLRCWNFTEGALKALQAYFNTEDVIDQCDKIEEDYKAFRVNVLGITEKKEKPLLMWSVGGRFAVAAHDRYEAAAIVRKHYGLKGLKTKRVVPTTKVKFNGETTTYGLLLDLFEVPGIVADFQEAA